MKAVLLLQEALGNVCWKIWKYIHSLIQKSTPRNLRYRIVTLKKKLLKIWLQECSSSYCLKLWEIGLEYLPWLFIGRTDIEAEVQILGPLNAGSWLTGKDPDAGKDWRQEEKGMTEDEMVGWHHQFSRYEPEQTLRDRRTGEPGVLHSWGCKESDTT